MKTRLRLLAMFIFSAILFATTWFGLALNDTVSTSIKSETPKTTGEVLIGKWEVIDQDPPLPQTLKAYCEYTVDGKNTITIEYPNGFLLLTRSNFYSLNRDTIRIDQPEGIGIGHQTWTAKVQIISDDNIKLSSIDRDTQTNYIVIKRMAAR